MSQVSCVLAEVIEADRQAAGDQPPSRRNGGVGVRTAQKSPDDAAGYRRRRHEVLDPPIPSGRQDHRTQHALQGS